MAKSTVKKDERGTHLLQRSWIRLQKHNITPQTETCEYLSSPKTKYEQVTAEWDFWEQKSTVLIEVLGGIWICLLAFNSSFLQNRANNKQRNNCQYFISWISSHSANTIQVIFSLLIMKKKEKKKQMLLFGFRIKCFNRTGMMYIYTLS